MYIKSSEKTTVSLWKFEAEWLSNQGAWWTCNPKGPSSSLTSWLNSGYTVSEIAPKSLFSGCSLGTGHQSILCLLCRILGLTFHSLRPYFYSDMEPLSAPFSATKWKPCVLGHDLGKHHDWPVKTAIVDLPISLKWNWKCIFGNSLSPLGTQKNDLSTASQTLLTGVTLHLRCRLPERWLDFSGQSWVRLVSNTFHF